MREDMGLYRGKRKDNGEWVEGYLCRKYFQEIPHDRVVIQYETKGNGEMRQPKYMVAEVIPSSIVMFTGLTDKNDKKIFEGDIGRYKQTDGAKENGKPIICTGKVIYNAKTASYAVESKDEKGRKYFDYFPMKDFEIIGNEWDNPELL